MVNPERAKLIPVTGNNDSPNMQDAIDVQFNPSTLKVSLSNTLKENERSGNSRSSQFVDKSSSSLSIELLFDTTYIDSTEATTNHIEEGSDVRLQTKHIAEKFIKPVPSGNKLKAPSRCLFQWGAFEFIGLIQSFDETLDFFSPEGRPLRSTISLKLSEDRYQFRNREVEQAARETPTLTSTGNNNTNQAGGGNQPNQNSSPVPGSSDNKAGNWRDTAMYNGVENPRLPSASMLAVPTLSASASIKINTGFSGGVNGNAGISASVSAGIATGISSSSSASINLTPPAFKFGASTSLGTSIEGAFGTSGVKGSLTASNLASGNFQLRTNSNSSLSPVKTSSSVKLKTLNSRTANINLKAKASVGFE